MVFIKKMINNGCTQIYGSSIDLTGKNVSITSDGFFVDGKPIVEFDESVTPVLKIEITGNVESLTTEDGEITVNGHVGTVVSKDGYVKCRTVGPPDKCDHHGPLPQGSLREHPSRDELDDQGASNIGRI